MDNDDVGAMQIECCTALKRHFTHAWTFLINDKRGKKFYLSLCLKVMNCSCSLLDACRYFNKWAHFSVAALIQITGKKIGSEGGGRSGNKEEGMETEEEVEDDKYKTYSVLTESLLIHHIKPHKE